MKKDAGYRLRERLQPFIEQDIQVLVEMERKLTRAMALANERACEPLVPGQTHKTYRL